MRYSSVKNEEYVRRECIFSLEIIPLTPNLFRFGDLLDSLKSQHFFSEICVPGV